MVEREVLLSTQAAAGLHYISEGSFGNIHHIDGEAVCCKSVRVHGSAHVQKLNDDFDYYREGATDSTPIASKSEFIIPQAIDYHNPYPSSPDSSTLNNTYGGQSIWKSFLYPTISPTLIPPFPSQISTAYKHRFWSPTLQADEPSDIRLLRLYFGKTDNPAQRTELHPGLRSDPPLETTQYIALSDELAREGMYVPSVEDVVRGMAEVLVRMHWVMGVNGRDAELFLGGDGGRGVGCYCLDFNQCQRWVAPHALRTLRLNPQSNITTPEYPSANLSDGTTRLATLIHTQEAYYPSPNQGTMYEVLRSAYMKAVGVMLEKLDKAGPERAGWEDRRNEIVGASEAFLAAYEKKDRQKAESKSRLRKSKA